MDDDREAYEFSHALYLARQVDREAAQLIVKAAEAGVIGVWAGYCGVGIAGLPLVFKTEPQRSIPVKPSLGLVHRPLQSY